MLRTLLSRLFATFHPVRHEERLREEIEAHLAELAEQSSRAGRASEADAMVAARRAFGPVEAAKERYRDQARFRPLENLFRDAHFALRQYGKNPAFTAAAIVSLALGIGANTALFSFVNIILLHQLPVPNPGELRSLQTAEKSITLSYDEVNAMSRQAGQFGTLLGSYPLDVSFSANQQIGGQPEWTPAELVTGDYFRTLGIGASSGRLLDRHDLDAAAGDPVCVISAHLWRTKFAGNAGVTGRTVLINTRPYQIVGVAAPGFRGTDLLRPADILIPVTRLPDYMPSFVGNSKFDWHSRLNFLSVLLRLNSSGQNMEAEATLTRLHREFLSEHKVDRAEKLSLVPADRGFVSGTHDKLAKPVTILLGVSLVVLLIACANLATLLLSRTAVRTHEFTLRLAIGGSPKRIFMQVLIESTLLALWGTVGGVGTAYAITHVLLAFLNRAVPSIHQLHVSVDAHVLAFTVVVAAFSVLLFGTAPAWQAAHASSAGSFSGGNARAGAGVRKIFVTAQIALSFLVVLSAWLFAQSLRHLATLDLGYVPDQIAAIDIRPASGGYTGERNKNFYKAVLERLRGTPGVKAAATALGLHLDDSVKMSLDAQTGAAKYQVNLLGVSPGYFETFGAHFLAGADFDRYDTDTSEGGYIISQHLAETYFHGRQAVGNYLLDNGRKIRVVGVVSNLRDESLRDGSLDTAYQNIDKLLASSLTVYVRCGGSCQPLMPTLRKTIHDWDPNTPILSLTTMQTQIEGSFSTEQALGFLSMLFGALALILVAAGLYGVLSYTLTRRTREIGIRMAIGALPSDIIGLFASETLLLLGLGTLVGIPLSLAAAGLLRSQLFGVAPHDLTALSICFACIVATVVLASIPPVRRALQIAPRQALRID